MDNVSITDLVDYKDFDYLEKVLEIALQEEHVSNAFFSVILVDEKTIQELNKTYRNKDSITDVISFAFEDNETTPMEEIRMLGDIYICIPRMKEQAVLYGHSEERELSFLAVHGVLHLLGYDHMVIEDEKIMFKKQDIILEKAGIRR